MPLKVFFMIVPLLIHLDPSKPFVLEMDIVDFRVVVVFSQLGEDNFLHPIGFRSCKFFHVEINYEICDKKFSHRGCLLWHHLFKGT
jgi:hypothetical protein